MTSPQILCAFLDGASIAFLCRATGKDVEQIIRREMERRRRSK